MDYSVNLNKLLDIDGALAAAIVDYETGMIIVGETHTNHIDLEYAAAGAATIVNAQVATLNRLKIDEEVEDILVTLGNQYHLTRIHLHGNKTPNSDSFESLFFYVVVDRHKGNLALARRTLYDLGR
ncbi:hypothetical protein [Stenoxybacter acetivorans]|uniref:hypothetical protein n=1 Tax=Stenoxybacter acetivorans TaxID=422441 RepID=UPI0005623EFE|nr:hypothetical protein [Stenoxybacter acetivorans]